MIPMNENSFLCVSGRGRPAFEETTFNNWGRFLLYANKISFIWEFLSDFSKILIRSFPYSQPIPCDWHKFVVINALNPSRQGGSINMCILIYDGSRLHRKLRDSGNEMFVYLMECQLD